MCLRVADTRVLGEDGLYDMDCFVEGNSDDLVWESPIAP